MSVGAVNSNATTPAYSGDYAAKTNETNTDVTSNSAGAVYEASQTSDKNATYKVNKMSAEDRKALVSKLKADAEARQSQLISLVDQMLSRQTNAYGQANGIMKFLSNGKYNVDPATKAQAKADISENGYYGVKQTADRMFDFASALAGDDVNKMKEMQKAIEKGYAMAEKTWGGKLPSICYQTRDAINSKFNDYYKSMGVEQ